MTPFCLSSLSLTLQENKLERLKIVIISGFDIIYRVRPEAYTNAVKHRKVASRKNMTHTNTLAYLAATSVTKKTVLLLQHYVLYYKKFNGSI